MGEARQFKQYAKRVEAINRFEPELELLDDDELKAQFAELRERADGRRIARRPAAGVLRHHPRGRPAHDGHAPLRRPADRRHGAALRRHRRDEDRRGQDPHRHARRRPQRDRRPRRPRRHGQRLPGPPRRGVDEPDLQLPRAQRRASCRTRWSHDVKIAAYAADITYGTNSEFGFDYLRDNMAGSLEEKVQHGQRITEDGKAVATHAFGIVDEVDNILIDEARTPLIISGAPEQAADLYVQFAKLARQMKAGKAPEGMDPKTKKEFVADFDFEFEEKHKTVSVTEQGVEKAERFLRIDHLYRAENGHLVNHLLNSLKAEALYKRDVDYAVDRRRGQDHRRVHRPHPRGAALVGGPAPGRRGQGGRGDPGGEPDPRHDHAAELLPHVRQARRHDGHGPHRGQRVHEDLQAGGRGHPDQPADGPRRPQRPDLQDQGRQVVGGRARDRRAPREGPARARRHHLRRGLRAALRAPAQRRGIPHAVLNAKPEFAEREGETVAEAGRPGAVTIATNMAGRGVDIKLGGNPEHLAELEVAKLGLKPGDPDYDEHYAQVLPTVEARVEERPPDRSTTPAACASSARSATSPAASTTSCAAAPAARATRASRASSCPPRTTSSACSPATASTASSTASRSSTTRATRSRSRPASSPSRSRTPSARSRSSTTSSASTRSSTTT